MSNRSMTPVILSTYRLVKATGCGRVDELVAVCRDCRDERGLVNV
jgi:hypothetical protein